MAFASHFKSALPIILFGTALAASAQTPAYLNPNLPIPQRVDDLVNRMTLAQKVSQMQNGAPAIPSLHIAAYDWWNEGLHGVARSGYATVFPQAIGLAATWNTSLIHQAADTISTEARAKYNQAQREGNTSIYYGLTFWSPNINIYRDPRWGRGQETYGEDPFLTGRIGTAFVEGLQGDDPHYLKVVATAKHYAVHSGPEPLRHGFNVNVSPYDLQDTYLPAFRALVVNGHVDSVMCAYNAIDGVPACANTMLLQKELHDDWHFNGYVVSDCAAISDVFKGHKFAPDAAHAAAVSVKAGTDLSCGHEYAALVDAAHQGLISEGEIDAAVKRLFTARFRLGMFDPADRVPFNRIPFSENDSPAHAALALKTADESMVLLKNEHAALPLKLGTQTIAVVGPNAASLSALEGNYNAIPSHPITPLEALQQRMPGHILYAQGSAYVDGASVPVPETLFTTGDAGHTQTGLLGEYFSGDLTGKPAMHRIDRHIDFDWNADSPAPGIAAKQFAVRWTGMLTPPAAGTIHFGFTLAHCSTCNDAESIRVWLDGKLVHEYAHTAAGGRRSTTPAFDLTFADTKPHALRIEYTHSAPVFGAGVSFNWQPPAAVLRAQAVAAAKRADVVVAFLGLSPDLEGEEMPVHVEGFNGGDRTRIELPEVQQQLVSALTATGKPTMIVLMNGSAVALGQAAREASAVLEAWYPGEAGGTAIADTLFGNNNPSGRLPVTFYASTSQLPPFEDYSMEDRTYRYFSGTPLYSFGYGLSYSTFQYTNGKLSSSSLRAGDPLNVSVDVANTSERDGEETVEAYIIPKGMVGTPRHELVGFTKVELKRGAKNNVELTIDPRQLSFVSPAGNRSIKAGDYELYVGGGQPTDESGVFLPFHIEGSAPVAP